MSCKQYRASQRICFIGLFIGCGLLIAGAIPNFWLRGKLEVDDLLKIINVDITIPFFGDYDVVDIRSGLWWYCYTSDLPLGDNKEDCETMEYRNEDGEIDFNLILPRLLCVVSGLLALLCGLLALWGGCGRTILHGVLAFLAGGAGIASVVTYVQDASQERDIVSLFEEREPDWALYVYGSGAALITLLSFPLCFLAP